jgi:protein-S-isoprenylcysteine O-methyltransferase Ste14
VPGLVSTAMHLVALGAAWLVLASAEDANPGRQMLMLGCGVAFFLSTCLSSWILTGHRLSWLHALLVAFVATCFQLGFAASGRAMESSPLGLFDALGLAPFVAGLVARPAAHLQRRRFRAKAKNAGRLCTSGLFALVRHPDYFGDLCLAVGWALITQNPAAGILPIAWGLAVALIAIPLLDAQLDARYGLAFRSWASRTKRVLPLLY